MEIKTKLIVALLVLMVAFSACAKKSIDSPDEFTREYAARLQTIVTSDKIEITGELQLKWKDTKGKGQVAYLNNSYNEYRQSPSEKDAIIARYVSASADARAKEDTLDTLRIIPMIKDVGWVDEMRRSISPIGSEEDALLVFEPLNHELVIVYAEDSPMNLRYFSEKLLSQAGVKKSELRSLAIANLRKLLPEVTIHGGPKGIWMVAAGGNYEASLLILDELWKGKRIAVDGDYIVTIPARGLLFVAGSNDKAAIAKMRELATKAAAESSYRLTADLFKNDDGRFTKFEP